MEKTEAQIYEEFAAQLCDWAESGKAPAAGNQDIDYSLTLQKKRLEKYRVRMNCKLNLRGEHLDHIGSAVFSDSKYTNKVVWRSYQREVSYHRENQKGLFKKVPETLYTIITWLNHTDIQTTYCCPNCGAISEVADLLNGCPYCHTRFLMSELFPKVTNFYFLPSVGINDKEAKHVMSRWMTAGALICMLIVTPSQVGSILHGDLLLFILLRWVFMGGLGAVFGYFALSLKLLAGVFKQAAKEAPMAVGQLRAKKKLTEFMKRFDPGFTYEYFIGKVQSLMKILIYTDDRSNLAVYEGPAVDGRFDRIIDAQFGGALSLNGCRMEGDYCYLDLNVYMEDVYCQGDRIVGKSDRFRMELCRNIRRPVDYGFSIRKVSCPSCGASFDAAAERYCPYCRTKYELKEDDWVITRIS